jgi:hypothetical protein
MKTFKLFLLVLLVSNSAFSQKEKIDNILNGNCGYISTVDVKDTLNKIYLETQAFSPDIINKKELEKLKGQPVYLIQVVSISNTVNKTFNEKALNRVRLESLYKTCPKLFEDEMISWVVIKGKAAFRTDGSPLPFHGFIIYYRKMPGKTYEEIDDVARGLSLGYSERSNGDDSIISKTFQRNKKWENIPVVADLTGSMSPYTVQLLLWFQLCLKKNPNKVESFTFFNDGDAMPDKDKQIGKTGGIYYSDKKSYDDIHKLAERTISGGCGGDGPENNLEAVLSAIKKNPHCKEVIMIADNYATPRDMSLLSQIHVPVRVIVCGNFGYINPAYLKIARDTKGSIHTMEKDILDLTKWNEGETITIDKLQYMIQGGKFIPVTKT